MMTKKEYLVTIRDRISCDSDAEREWDAYRGSLLLLQGCWDLYQRRGEALGVRPEVAGYMMNAGVDKATASAVFRPARRVVLVG